MKHTILFLAANPGDTSQLALQEECAAIEHELRLTSGRDDFCFHSRWAVSVDALMRHLNELSPTVLHFSGHGTGGIAAGQGARHRDADSPRGAGILLQDRDGSQHVSGRALAGMIKHGSPATRLVVLNACCSAAIADSLREVVDCVVGIDGAIEDTVARSFAVAFYRALGNRRSVGNAVAQAAATLDAKQQPDHLLTFRTRDGLDANQLVLSDPIEDLEPQLGKRDAWPATRHYDLLLAHSSANKASACALYDLLLPDTRVFLAERSLQRSETWDREILAAQRVSRATVLMISPQCDAAWYLSDEVINAIVLHRASPDAHRIVPVLLGPGATVPYSISRLPAIDAAPSGGLDGVAARLRGEVAEMRRRPPPQPSPSEIAGPGSPSGTHARADHVRLYCRLGQLHDATFEQIVSHAGIAREALAPRTASLERRALDVAQLAALDPHLCRRVTAELDRRAL